MMVVMVMIITGGGEGVAPQKVVVTQVGGMEGFLGPM